MFKGTVMEICIVFSVLVFLLCLTVPMSQCISHISLNKGHFNKRLLGYTLVNQTGVVLPLCAKSCMYVQQCVSINYCVLSKTCEMNAVNSVDADPADFVDDEDWNYIDIALWAKVTKTCENKTCGQNDECLPTRPEAICVELPGCSMLQPIANAALKPGGTLVNTTRTYTCDPGYAAMDGALTIVNVCHSDETWTNEGEICHLMCTPGSYSINGFEPCTTCPLNTYQPDQRKTSCQSCPPGTITMDTGRTAATECKVLCLPGRFSSNKIEPCTSCPLNTYQQNSGQTGCLSCPDTLQTRATGSTSISDCEVRELSQWVASVYLYSTEFTSTIWSANQIIGSPDTYPNYGDLVTSWAQKTLDANQFIEVVFDVAVFITGIDIYEIYNSGGVLSIVARDLYGQTHTLWSTTKVFELEESRIFSPTLQVVNKLCKQVRLNVDCSLSNDWVEIDAVRLHGNRW